MNIDIDPFEDHPPLYSAAAVAQAEREAAREERARIRQALFEAFSRKEFDDWHDAVDVKKIAESVCAGADADGALASLLGDLL